MGNPFDYGLGEIKILNIKSEIPFFQLIVSYPVSMHFWDESDSLLYLFPVRLCG